MSIAFNSLIILVISLVSSAHAQTTVTVRSPDGFVEAWYFTDHINTFVNQYGRSIVGLGVGVSKTDKKPFVYASTTISDCEKGQGEFVSHPLDKPDEIIHLTWQVNGPTIVDRIASSVCIFTASRKP